MEKTPHDDFFNPMAVLLALVLLVLMVIWCSCSSHHYFSINAEEITNPSIMYSDSTSLTNPW